MVRLKVLSLTRTHEAGKILLAESRAFYAASAADRTFGNAGTARALIAASFFRHCTHFSLAQLTSAHDNTHSPPSEAVERSNNGESDRRYTTPP
ncbi:hypothetical protein MUK42_02992 [Musa troglodytarum]|uniref:Uncharacterized protein n=1 Tax=Musa troglodytarum TaxID=320322 RepID=A0A9E7I1I5_9LILI|nr:hypothetical protein MUK42_02992 [Musa troglodytarum]